MVGEKNADHCTFIPSVGYHYIGYRIQIATPMIQGRTLDDSDSPVAEFTYNDHGSDTDNHIANIIDFPFDGENDPGSA
ncbi:hypothetical protein OS493_031428 [Desmophyllum pertusum]|uniref:Uncharacterized protein n=1 Tax=Desmophyllum pertusum TaxID=174260 RepID=A0A9X0D942_9CNID|nr:hypothetical protein OS493_031428 [Desmophyllum pertusum]